MATRFPIKTVYCSFTDPDSRDTATGIAQGPTEAHIFSADVDHFKPAIPWYRSKEESIDGDDSLLRYPRVEGISLFVSVNQALFAESHEYLRLKDQNLTICKILK